MSQHKEDELVEARALLRLSAQQFRFYEKSHRIKNTPDSLEKAEVNKMIAILLEKFLSENKLN